MKYLPGLFALAGLLLAGTAQATQAEHVHAHSAWIRLLPGDLPAGGYVTLQNQGDQAVRLEGANSPVYAQVMLHQSSDSGGMGRMAMVDHLDIPAHGQVELSPGGYHLMLEKPASPVKTGDAVKIDLRFADGSLLHVDFAARPANALGP